MCSAIYTIRKTGVTTDHFDIGFRVTNAHPQLVPVSAGIEGGKTAYKRDLSSQRHASRNAHHVLFGDTQFKEAIWKRLGKPLSARRLGQVSRQDDDVFVLHTQLH